MSALDLAAGGKRGGKDEKFIAVFGVTSDIVETGPNAKVIEFTQEMILMLVKVMKTASHNKKRAVLFKTLLEDTGCISTEATFEEIEGNSALNRLIRLHMVNGLEKEASTSNFFPEWFSDWDLATNGTTETKLNQMVALNHPNMSAIDRLKLIVQSKKVTAFVNRTKREFMDNMEFPGSPDRASHKKLVNAADAESRIKAQNDKVQAINQAEIDGKKRKAEGAANGEEEEEEEEEEAEPIEGLFMTESEVTTSSSSSSKKKPSKRLINALIECFPELIDSKYALQLVDGELVVTEFE